MDNKAKTMKEAKQKAERLREEAKELLKDAQDKLQRLAGKCVRDTQRTEGSSYNSVLCFKLFYEFGRTCTVWSEKFITSISYSIYYRKVLHFILSVTKNNY